MNCNGCHLGVVCSCGLCHTCGHRWNYPYDIQKACSAPNTVNKPKTQKALGMWALRKYIHQVGLSIAMPKYTLGLDATEDKVPLMDYPLFARPCPIQPRHGFVDSREVKDWAELSKVIEETRAADPDGEVMLLKYIPSEFNAVWIPNLLTIGKGNDGATAGKDTITFPLCGVMDEKVMEAKGEANVPKSQDPYIEAVYEEGNHACHVTQLRAGPKLSGSGVDYLPVNTVIKAILKVDRSLNLLQWEEVIQSVEKPGLVVWHPGGSPADHFSVHCRTCSIPVCVTFQPKVGQVIDAVTTTPKLDPGVILRGVVAGDMFPLKHKSNPYDNNEKGDGKQAINLVLHALHHSSAIGGDASYWLGIGVAFMLRYGTIALRGEARHIKHPMPGRDSVYAHAIPFSLQRQRASTPALINVLRYGNFSGAVGGIKWAQCGNATAKLFDAVGKLAKDPTVESANNLLRAFNFAVNQAHNGGWWLNKFIGAAAFNEVQNGVLSNTLTLVPFLVRVREGYEKVTEGDVSKRLTQWAKWMPIKLTHPNLIKANIVTVPGIAGLAIQVEDKLLKKHHKPLIINIPTLIEKLPSLIKGKLYVETTPEGLQILLSPPHEDPIVLWKEDQIG